MVGSLRGGGRSGGQGGVFGLAQQGADARQRFGLGGFVQRDLVVHGAAQVAFEGRARFVGRVVALPALPRFERKMPAALTGRKSS